MPLDPHLKGLLDFGRQRVSVDHRLAPAVAGCPVEVRTFGGMIHGLRALPQGVARLTPGSAAGRLHEWLSVARLVQSSSLLCSAPSRCRVRGLTPRPCA